MMFILPALKRKMNMLQMKLEYYLMELMTISAQDLGIMLRYAFASVYKNSTVANQSNNCNYNISV